MLVRDQFTTPLAVLEGVRARVVEIRVATLNAAVAQEQLRQWHGFVFRLAFQCLWNTARSLLP